MKQAQSALVDEFPKDSVSWLKRLIAFDTTSAYSNLSLIADVAAYCGSLGLTVDLTHNAEHTKANLFVTVTNAESVKKGEPLSGGIVLSGHTDVVPVAGQNWQSPPFQAEIREGKLYGRGACDMKGFIACALSILPKAVQLAQSNQLKRPLHLALSFDEEVGCLGAPLLLEDIQNKGIFPQYCIVGEPTSMKLVSAHKGIRVFRCLVHGKSVHSSLTPKGVNAISYASRLIGFIDDLAENLQHQGSLDEGFDVPFSTLSVGTIRGGTATNIVPNLCEFTFDFRNLPHVTVEEILLPIQNKIEQLTEEMRQVCKQAQIELIEEENVPAMTDKDSQELQKLVGQLVGDEHVSKVAYATEGGQFTQAGIATIICGPGSIEQAHQANEYISLEQLKKCDKFLGAVLEVI